MPSPGDTWGYALWASCLFLAGVALTVYSMSYAVLKHEHCRLGREMAEKEEAIRMLAQDHYQEVCRALSIAHEEIAVTWKAKC